MEGFSLVAATDFAVTSAAKAIVGLLKTGRARWVLRLIGLDVVEVKFLPLSPSETIDARLAKLELARARESLINRSEHGKL
jgi:hypothetical protein